MISLPKNIDQDEKLRKPQNQLNKYKSFGAKEIFCGQMDSLYFDYPDKRLENTGIMLRLRTEGENTRLTLKQSITKTTAKIADEQECRVDNSQDMKEILGSLGLEAVKQSSKHRQSFHLDGTAFEIDTYEGIPPFLEIEAPSIEKCHEAVRLLGYRLEQARPWSGKDVLRHYANSSAHTTHPRH